MCCRIVLICNQTYEPIQLYSLEGGDINFCLSFLSLMQLWLEIKYTHCSEWPFLNMGKSYLSHTQYLLRLTDKEIRKCYLAHHWVWFANWPRHLDAKGGSLTDVSVVYFIWKHKKASNCEENPLTLASIYFSVHMHIKIHSLCKAIKDSFIEQDLWSAELRPNTILLDVVEKNTWVSPN